MNQALYPADKIEWCVYAPYKQDTERIGTYCTIITMYRHANMAQSLDGYLWAVSSLKKYYVWVAIPTQGESSLEYGKGRRLKNWGGCELFIRFILA